jgi:hypothetical protein
MFSFSPRKILNLPKCSFCWRLKKNSKLLELLKRHVWKLLWYSY